MSKKLKIYELGKVDYDKALQLQKDLQQKRINGQIDDVLLLVNHPPVYTLGKNADESNILISDEELDKESIQIYNIERGGDVTYHGPGQLIGYPIFNIKELGMGIRKYVNLIEEVIIQMLAYYNINANRIEKLTGVWLDNKKITAIGIRVSRWVSMHGFALNIDVDLSKFQDIIPCGIDDKDVTQMKDEISGSGIDRNTLNQIIIDKFMELFQFKEFELHKDHKIYSQINE